MNLSTPGLVEDVVQAREEVRRLRSALEDQVRLCDEYERRYIVAEDRLRELRDILHGCGVIVDVERGTLTRQGTTWHPVSKTYFAGQQEE